MSKYIMTEEVENPPTRIEMIINYGASNIALECLPIVEISDDEMAALAKTPLSPNVIDYPEIDRVWHF